MPIFPLTSVWCDAPGGCVGGKSCNTERPKGRGGKSGEEEEEERGRVAQKPCQMRPRGGFPSPGPAAFAPAGTAGLPPRPLFPPLFVFCVVYFVSPFCGICF